MRELVKAGLRFLALVAVSPLLLSFWLWSLVLGRDRALEGSSQTLALVPGLVGVYLRRAFLMRVLAHCHKTATVEFGTLFSQTGARIDENVYVGPRCHLGFVHIERDALLGPCVHVPAERTHGTEDPSRPIREQEHGAVDGPNRSRCVDRSAAVVMADVGAIRSVWGRYGSDETAVPANVVAAGVPAKSSANRIL